MNKTLLVLLALVAMAMAQCDFKINTQLLLEDSDAKLLQEVENGQKYLIGSLDDPKKNYLYVANLKGSSREMGKAYGQLFKNELKQQLHLFFDFYMDQLKDVLQKRLPKFLANDLTEGVEGLLKRVLDLNIMITRRYTHPRYFEEINGIAEGSGVHAKYIAQVNIFPELIKAACTVAGVWGKATAHNELLHVRALDWDANNTINKYPLATIYHSSTQGEIVNANFAWVGFIGSMTGMSPKLSLGEKVWLPKHGSVQMTRYGNPWTYMFRDILYDAHNIETALSIMSTTHRTCAIHIGLGSAEDNSFRMFEYAENTLNNYDDKNYTHYGDAHPKLQGVAFFDKHVQPSHDSCLGDLFQSDSYYGYWTAENLWRTIGPSHKTGNTQLAVFNLATQQVYISYSEHLAEKDGDAYNRRPILMNMQNWWKPF